MKVITKEGKIRLQEELNYLLTVEKARVIEDLSDARESGNLEENSQYILAKEEYDKLLLKIEKLSDVLNNSTVINSSIVNPDKVSLLTTVKVINIFSNKEVKFSIVPDNEIDVKLYRISPSSPIASGLMGKSIGDICEVNTPGGIIKYKIINITPCE